MLVIPMRFLGRLEMNLGVECIRPDEDAVMKSLIHQPNILEGFFNSDLLKQGVHF